MTTRSQGKPSKQRAGRDGGVKANVRPKRPSHRRPPAASSIKRYYDGDKLRRKPLGKKLLLQSALKPESLVKSSAPHLLGSLLRQVRKGGRERGFHYFLDPNSPAAILGYSTTARRTKTGHAKIDATDEKECGAESGAAATCTVCQVTVGDMYFGIRVKPCMFVIDHHTEKVVSWCVSKKKGTTAAHLKAGVAQFLCAFCNADKTAADSVGFARL